MTSYGKDSSVKEAASVGQARGSTIAGKAVARAEERTREQLREHYVIEKALAARLRAAARAERRTLYKTVYDERAQRIPHHPLVVRAGDPAAQARAAAPQARLIRRFAGPQTRFLEIGPGDCALAVEVAKFVRHVTAIDVSGELVKAVRRPENFEFRLFGGLELPLERESIDLAYSNDVMEHLHPEDALDQLKSLLAALAPGGRYLCITPNRLSGPHDVSRHFDEVATGFHLKEYTVGELADLLSRAGFARVNALVSVNGRSLSPLLPIFPFQWVEAGLEKLPRGPRVKLARFLTAVKVIATK
jgi:SAM-dependent methyltransferase